MSTRAALRPLNKDAPPAKIMRKDTKPRKGGGKEHMSTVDMPPWKFSMQPSTIRKADIRVFRGMQPKVEGQWFSYLPPPPPPPPAPAPTPRTVTPQSSNDKRRPPYHFTQQKFIHEYRQIPTVSPPFTKRIIKAPANPAKRLCLSTAEKGKKKIDGNENYPDDMKSAENSTSSLIETLWKSNKRKKKSYSWNMLHQALRDDNIAPYMPQGVSYQSVARKQRRGSDAWEMEKSVWEDDPATVGSLCRKIISPVTHEMGVVTPGKKAGKFTQRGIFNNCSIVNETPAKYARHPTSASSNRLMDPPAARRPRIESKADAMKATGASENAAHGRTGSVSRRDKAAIKMMENSNRSAFRRISTPFRPCNPTVTSKRSIYPEEGLKKRQNKITLEDHLISFLLPSIPECQPRDEISQNAAFRSLVSWKEWVRNLDPRMSQATTAATGTPTFPLTKERAQEIGQMSAKDASRSVSEKIRSTFVKRNNLPLRGTGGRPRSKSRRRKVQYPKELMSASESESESKMKYNPSYIHRNMSLTRGNKFRRNSNFNFALPGSSAEIYPWCMSNEPIETSKRTI